MVDRPRLCLLASAATVVLTGSAWAQAPATPAPGPSAPPAASAPPASASAVPSPSSLADALTGSARDDYLAARALYARGEYADALVRFYAAYQASQDPRLLWNAAVCEKAMGHYANAIALVGRYLDSGSPSITPQAARSARAFVTAAESRTALVAVLSNEPDARIYVDGEPVGTTPIVRPIRVDQGAHEISLKKDGFEEFSTSVTLSDATEFHIEARLTPIVGEGRIVVHARRGDAIAVDGRVVGGETWEGTLPGGTHRVYVTAPGSRPFQDEVLVRDGETRTIDVRLEPDRRAAGVPAWLWVVGGVVLAAGATTAGYLLVKSHDEPAAPVDGSIATVHLPLH